MALASVVYVSFIVTQTGFPSSMSKAQNAYSISADEVSDQSGMQDDQGSTYFYLTSEQKTGLYTLPENSSASVIQYLSKKPTYTLSADGTQTRLIQDDAKNIQLKSRLTDSEVNFLKLSGVDSGDTHYYFQQMRCDGVPVYGSYINVHVNGNNEVYALTGALAKTETSCERKLSRDTAEKIALDTFTKQVKESSVAVTQSNETVFSPKLSDQENNASYLSQRIEVCGDKTCHAYFVDLGSGRVLYDVPTSTDTMNRYIRLSSGSTQRREGDAASSNTSINRVYDFMGEIYNFYSGTLQRDSYNNAGGLMQVVIDTGCPQIDASWNGVRIYICSNTVAQDVLAHEFQHGVTQYAVGGSEGLEYRDESGALNESLSDIFAAALDSNDWDMGEDTSIGAIRSLENPGRFKDPDSVYSSTYYCGSSQSASVHTNSGVFNKAFYLMSDGGTFPATGGCTMTGIGREAAIKVVYKALTTYIKGNSKGNYKDMYNAMVSACTDIYQTPSAAECQNITVAMQAVGMDKQVVGQQKGLKCRGVATQPLTCIGGQPPSSNPLPTTPGTEPTSSPTAEPSRSPSTEPSVTAAPTSAPVPTSGNTMEANVPLLSPWSLPTFVAGNLKVRYDGKNYTLRATIESRDIQTLVGNKRQSFGDEYIKARLIGAKNLEAEPFEVDGDEIFSELKTSEDISAYSAYEVYFPAANGYPELPLLIADLSGSLAGQASAKDKVALTLKIRMQGIESKPKSTEAQLVRIGVGGVDLPEIIYKRVLFTPSDNGIWEGKALFDVPAGSSYKVLVKGPRHLQKKYCDNSPTEAEPGQYICPQEQIELKKGENLLDFSKVMQLAGDVNQDGVVNSQDILSIRNNIGSYNIDNLIVGDMNNDGVINAVDDTLIIYTLSNRSDTR